MDSDAAFYLNLKLLLAYIILIPTYVLYIMVLYVIFISKYQNEYSSPFYKLFGISSIFNVFSSIIYALQARFPNAPAMLPFVQSWGIRSFMVTFIYTGIFYSYNVCHLLNLFISFNRFTVFLLKARYKSFWRQWLPWIIGICLIFPICLTWNVPFTDIYMKPRNVSDPEGLRRFGIGKPENFSFMNTAEFTVYLLTVTTSISLIFNVYVVIRLAKDKFINPVTDLQKKKILTQEIKLCFYTMIVFASDMVYCIQQFIKKASINDQSFVFNIHVQVAIADVTVLTPIWFMILSNQLLRRHIAANFFAIDCKLSSVSSVISYTS